MIVVITPQGFYGKSDSDTRIDSVLRKIALLASADPNSEWPEKYGTDFENSVFMMHPYCWCEEESCRWCGSELAPNFWYKPLDFKLTWYKYISRCVETNKTLTQEQLLEMEEHCLLSLSKENKELLL